MSCIDGKAHVYEPQGSLFICIKCEHVSSYQITPSYEEVLAENARLQNLCQNLADHLIRVGSIFDKEGERFKEHKRWWEKVVEKDIGEVGQ